MSKAEDRVTKLLATQLNKELSRNSGLRKELALKRLDSMDGEIRNIVDKDAKLKRYLTDVKVGVREKYDSDGLALSIEDAIGKRLASYMVHQNRFEEYYKTFEKVYWNRVSKIHSLRSKRNMFKKSDLNLAVCPRSRINSTDITGELNDENRIPTNYRFYRARRKAQIWIGKPHSIDWSDEKYSDGSVKSYTGYVSHNESDGNLYLASKYPKKYPYAIYTPYLINNQPVAKRRVFWYDNGSMQFGRKTWWNKQDKGFVKDVVKRFNRSKSKPSWVYAEYNKELFK